MSEIITSSMLFLPFLKKTDTLKKTQLTTFFVISPIIQHLFYLPRYILLPHVCVVILVSILKFYSHIVKVKR